jgi:signal transduction histidine kinase
MRSIGIKIFLSFWLTHALIFVVMGIWRDSRTEDTRLLEDVSREGVRAAAVYEEVGRAGCTALLSVVGRERRMEMALYAETGTLVCASSDAADGQLGTFVRSHAEDSTDEPDGDRRRVVAQVTGHKHGKYRMATVRRRDVGPPPDRPFPWDFWLIAVLVSGVVCFGLSRYLTRPLRDISKATRRLAEGDLSARAGSTLSPRLDEIGELVRDFDAMAERIAALIASQKQLLSDISHELRSPLARLQVAVELARRKAGPAAENDLNRIQGEADRMTDMIGQLLAVSRSESDVADRQFETFDLGEVVQGVVEDTNYEARTTDTPVVLEIRRVVTLEGDPELLASAVENVVRNAARYAPKGTPVEVLVTGDAGRAQVIVRDLGPGVEETALKDIFSPFFRVGSSRDRSSGGVGLGLSIAQRAVNLHKGHISAQNAESGGLVVTIDLPALTITTPVQAAS